MQHKERARAFIKARARHFAGLYGLRYNKISIRNQKTRWGSCSKKGNLNFHYKLALVPLDLADYVIAHEICHLAEFNHSKKFWNLVSQAIPDYRALRKALQKIPMG